MNPELKKSGSAGPLRTLSVTLLLVVLPLLYFGGTRALNEKRGPLWLGSNSDPTYCYLLNSLLIINHQPTYLVEHPGTSAQLGGAAILRARHPFLSVEELNRLVLTQPEAALNLIITTVNAGTALLLFGFGFLLWKRTDTPAVVVLFQATLLFFHQTYYNCVFFSPEIFFPPLALGLGFVCFQAHDRESGPGLALTAGLLAALGLMIKYTFVPFLALGVFAFPARKSKIVYLTTFLVVVAIFVYFIHHELTRTWQWVSNLATHSGQYGGGPKEMVNWARYFPALREMLLGDPFYVPLLLTGVAGPLLTLGKWTWAEAARDRTNRLLLALTALEAGCFVITAKHPAAHYLTPVVAMAPLHLLLLGKQFGRLLAYPRIRLALITLVVAGGLYGGSRQFRISAVVFEQAAASQVEACKKLTEWLGAKEPSAGYLPVMYYRNSSVEYSLLFGNGYARNYFTPLLSKLYPDAWFFNIFNARFQNFSEMITGADFYEKHPHPVFFGSNSIETMPFGLQFPLPQGGHLQPVWKNDQAAIHEISYP